METMLTMMWTAEFKSVTAGGILSSLYSPVLRLQLDWEQPVPDLIYTTLAERFTLLWSSKLFSGQRTKLNMGLFPTLPNPHKQVARGPIYFQKSPSNFPSLHWELGQ